MSEKRMGWIDIAKILGLVIVLMNHADLVIGPVNYFGGMFYVPIFFVLAGYTYRCRTEVPFTQVVKKKAKRLLVPYFGYNAFLFLFFFLKDSVLAGTVSAASLKPLFGILYSRSYLYAGSLEGQEVLMSILNGPTWFLTGLFTASLGFELLCRWAKRDNRRLLGAMAVCFCIAWGLDLMLPVLLPWSLDTMFFHMVLMGAGYLFREKLVMESFDGKPGRLLLVLVVFVSTSILSGTGNLSIRSYGRFPIFYLCAALSGSRLVMWFSRWLERQLGRFAKLLAYAGERTIGILCLHLFVFMFFRAACGAVGIPAGNPAVQAVMIVGSFAALTVYEAAAEWGRERISNRIRGRIRGK